MSDERMVESCERLWQFVTSDGEYELSGDADRKADGSYVTGHRNYVETWTRAHRGLTATAKRVSYQTFDPRTDTSGTRRILEVARDGTVVFKAIEEGESKIEKFGAEERYIGTDEKPASPWKVMMGELPTVFEAVTA